MLASKMIAELQKLVDEFGDLELQIGEDYARSVAQVYFVSNSDLRNAICIDPGLYFVIPPDDVVNQQ